MTETEPAADTVGTGVIAGAPRREGWWIALACVAALLPFVFKPSHIDDHIYLVIADQIAKAPLDPFGLRVNWFGFMQPMVRAQQNPPGFSYLLAPALAVGGLALSHVVVMVCAIAALLGTRVLAIRLRAPPLVVALAVVSTPVFLVCSTTLMCDVPMLALFVWSMVLWLDGLDRGDERRLWLAGALALAAILTKFFALALVPLLVFSAVARGRVGGLAGSTPAPTSWYRPILGVAVGLVAYDLVTDHLYGVPHLFGAIVYANTQKVVVADAMSAAGYIGGCVVGLLAWTPWLLRRREAAVWVALTAVAVAVVLVRGRYGQVPMTSSTGSLHLTPLVHVVVSLASTSLLVTVLGTVLLRAARQPPTWKDVVVFVWIAGVVAFAVKVNWTLAARSVLPLVPPLVCLLAQELRGRTRDHLLALVPGAMLSLAVADGDTRLANAQADAADRALEFAPPEHLWFLGHWGFQTQMEARGATALSLTEHHVKAGDVVVWNSLQPVERLPPGFEQLPPVPIEVGGLVRTCQGGGFYSDFIGPWPFVVGAVPPFKLHRAVATRDVPPMPTR